MLTEHGIAFFPVPPLRRSKNVFESKNGIIRSIILLLLTAENPPLPLLSVQRAIRISNDLYVSDTLSAFEMSNGFSRQLPKIVHPISDDLVEY